jgi:cyclic pyranopterin phosphate synthase
LNFAALAHDEGFNMRFIEYMPFDGKKSWDIRKVVTGEEILSKIGGKYKIIPLERQRGSTAVNYRFADGGGGEFGIISSITRPFCSDCDRLRLTADGRVIPCLFGEKEYDVSYLLRKGASDSQIASFLEKTVRLKPPGVESLLKASVELKHVRPMYSIGG